MGRAFPLLPAHLLVHECVIVPRMRSVFSCSVPVIVPLQSSPAPKLRSHRQANLFRMGTLTRTARTRDTHPTVIISKKKKKKESKVPVRPYQHSQQPHLQQGHRVPSGGEAEVPPEGVCESLYPLCVPVCMWVCLCRCVCVCVCVRARTAFPLEERQKYHLRVCVCLCTCVCACVVYECACVRLCFV